MTPEPKHDRGTTDLERTYPTSTEELWELWTTPAGIESWWAPDGFTIEMDKTNHHLHKPVFIAEIKGDGQFNVVWKTKGPVRAQPWSPFIEGNAGKPEKPA